MNNNRGSVDDEALRRDPVRRIVFFVCIALILAPSVAAVVGMVINR